MSTKHLRYNIIESIKLLASDGQIQLDIYPDFVCKGDEIANSLGDWLLLYRSQIKVDEKYAFSEEELLRINNLDIEFLRFDQCDFSDEAILTSCKWEELRIKAKEVLDFLKEEYSLPDKNVV